MANLIAANYDDGTNQILDNNDAFFRHAAEHADVNERIYGFLPTAKTFVLRRQSLLERQSRATYHATFLSGGDFYAIAPIIGVTRTPTDPTYTSDDVYDSISFAPTSSVLPSGLPNASEGNGSWTVSSNQVFSRQPGASTTTPQYVVGTPIPCKSIARVDGGPGRLAMSRVWSLGSIHALASTTRMPVVDDSPLGTLANNQLWDTEFPLSGMGQYYYKNSTDHASTDQASFGAVSTRWAASCILGCKFFYSKPSVTVIGCGDSIMGGDYAEAGHPTRCSYGWRASYALLQLGKQIDYINAGFSGFRWDQFGQIMKQLVAQLKPDIVLLPIHCGNGITAGVGIGYTNADAHLQVAIAMEYAEWALNNGAKDVIFVTPMPSTTPNYNPMYAYMTSIVAASGYRYLDTMSIVANPDLTWKTGYSIDGGHPTALANAALAEVLSQMLIKYTNPA